MCNIIKKKQNYLYEVVGKGPQLIMCSYCDSLIERQRYRKRVSEEYKVPVRLLTIDHMVPVSKGCRVKNTKNWTLSCEECNTKKGDKAINKNRLIKQLENDSIRIN